MNDLLNDEELVDSPLPVPSKQCGALTRAGISYVKRRDGRPRVAWTHVNAALSGARSVQIAEEERPNFDAI